MSNTYLTKLPFQSITQGEHVQVNVKAEIGFMNEKAPEIWEHRPIYVCLLAETSDGHKVYFCRIG